MLLEMMHTETPFEKTLGILINIWVILWSHIKFSVQLTTKIIMICWKIHNYIFGNDHELMLECSPNHHEKNIRGEKWTLDFQDLLQTECETHNFRNRNNTSSIRDGIAKHLQTLGFVRRENTRYPSPYALMCAEDHRIMIFVAFLLLGHAFSPSFLWNPRYFVNQDLLHWSFFLSSTSIIIPVCTWMCCYFLQLMLTLADFPTRKFKFPSN